MALFSRPTSSGATRSPLILVLLLGSLALAALLGWQAYDAAKSHRASAEGVLRDYAGLAADEQIRRSFRLIGYDGYYTLITKLSRLTAEREALPTIEELRATLNDPQRSASALVRQLFLYSPGETLQTTGIEPAVAALLRETLDRDREWETANAPFLGLRFEIDGQRRRFVFAKTDAGVLGFEVEHAALEQRLRQAFEIGSLLPGSLAAGDDSNSWVAISVLDVDGTPLFRTGKDYPIVSARRPFGDTYNGILDGLEVVASIDPASTTQLVIGGVPRSRVPLLLTMFVTSAGLLFAAARLLLREHALAKLRADFVSRVSHELRTPLTQVRMFTETLLLDRVRSRDEVRRSLEIIDREARRLTHLVENILQFSRSERDAVELRIAPRDLADLVREVVGQFRRLTAAGVTLSTELEQVRVAVDDDAMRQIVLNLLDNAVKYGPDEQEVIVSVATAGERVRMWVEDEGPGIPENERERVWEPFYRLHGNGPAATTGTGIGLAVVRDLVDRQGGSCRVEPGRRRGARLIVEFPLFRAEPEAAG